MSRPAALATGPAREIVRVLLLADTHLGLDLPLRPRVERRRRGPDLFANTERALAAARRGEVDLVVHGGDLLYRSKVSPRLVTMAVEPLLQVADRGVPVILVPGNHERSHLPYGLLASHRHLYLFDRPRTICLTVRGIVVSLVGFPCLRNGIRDRFREQLAAAETGQPAAHIRLLCLHQTVEGAQVGPVSYTFRRGPDIIRAADLPSGFAAVLAGHIHRHQVLISDLAGQQLPAPVLYPGSIERISTAERHEAKGYLVLELQPGGAPGGRLHRWRFQQLPARAMVDLELTVSGRTRSDLEHELWRRLAAIDPEAIVQILPTGEPTAEAAVALAAPVLRSLAPATMTVSVRWPRPARS